MIMNILKSKLSEFIVKRVACFVNKTVDFDSESMNQSQIEPLSLNYIPCYVRSDIKSNFSYDVTCNSEMFYESFHFWVFIRILEMSSFW